MHISQHCQPTSSRGSDDIIFWIKRYLLFVDLKWSEPFWNSSGNSSCGCVETLQLEFYVKSVVMCERKTQPGLAAVSRRPVTQLCIVEMCYALINILWCDTFWMTSQNTIETRLWPIWMGCLNAMHVNMGP